MGPNDESSGSHDGTTDMPTPPAERWRQMAAGGDVRGLLDDVNLALPGTVDYREYWELLRQALGVRAKSDPGELAELLQADMMVATGNLLIHLQLALQQQVDRELEDRQKRGTWHASADLESLTAAVMALQLHVVKLRQTDANTQRQLEQTRKQRLANDKTEAKKNRPRRVRRQRGANGRTQPAAASRIGEVL